MPAVTSILLGTALAGTALSGYGTVEKMVGSHKLAKASKAEEAAREHQLEVDNQRKQRDEFRKGQIARATATENAVSQGAEKGSGLQGGLAQITGATNRGVLESAENAKIGKDIFAAKRDQASAQEQIAMGSAIAGFGSTLVQDSRQIGQIGSNLWQNPFNNARA